MPRLSLPKHKIRVLLLEGVNDSAVALFADSGYSSVERLPKAERSPGRYVRTDYAKCVGCHICHDVCPSGYIKMGLGE